MKLRPVFLTLLAGFAFGVCSCTVSDNSVVTVPIPGGVGVVDALPVGWTQPSYYYNSRYYYGGSWETGHYDYNGHAFTNRYLYKGQYFYGGRYSDGHHHGGGGQHKAKKKHHEDLNQDMLQARGRY